MVADADKRIAVIAVEFFVFIIVMNQRFAYPHGNKGGENHENKHEIHDAMRNIDAKHRQHTRQAPQHDGELQRCEHGIEHAAHKFNGGDDEILRVLLDTLVNVVGGVAFAL